MKNKSLKKIDETVDMYSKIYNSLVSKGKFEKAFEVACDFDQKISDLGIDITKVYN